MEAIDLIQELLDTDIIQFHSEISKSKRPRTIDSSKTIFCFKSSGNRKSEITAEPLRIQSLYFFGNGISLPKMVPVLFMMRKVACGTTHCCAISDEKRLWVWGTFHNTDIFFYPFSLFCFHLSFTNISSLSSFVCKIRSCFFLICRRWQARTTGRWSRNSSSTSSNLTLKLEKRCC